MRKYVNDNFNLLIQELNKVLNQAGFVKKANSFYKNAENNWGVINLQKGQGSSPDNIKFTINVGVCSGKLWEFYNEEPLAHKPGIEDCHWRKRIGHILSEHNDKWWVITSKTSMQDLSREIEQDIINYVVPELNRYITDDALIELWLQGKSDGITKLERLLNLSILLKSGSNNINFKIIINELLTFSHERSVTVTIHQHINRLNKDI